MSRIRAIAQSSGGGQVYTKSGSYADFPQGNEAFIETGFTPRIIWCRLDYTSYSGEPIFNVYDADQGEWFMSYRINTSNHALQYSGVITLPNTGGASWLISVQNNGFTVQNASSSLTYAEVLAIP